ncbi:hypothetical protein KSP40_PGU002877 [Platanthera guangdongensis]|uniref:BRISC and BRCA1-A complex member 2 n=1 Tax=Platanthera guangdongensis TaxID=2320717 RepID=A0ABR2LFU8_9ASPA
MEGGGGCSKRSFLGRFSRRAGGWRRNKRRRRFICLPTFRRRLPQTKQRNAEPNRALGANLFSNTYPSAQPSMYKKAMPPQRASPFTMTCTISPNKKFKRYKINEFYDLQIQATHLSNVPQRIAEGSMKLKQTVNKAAGLDENAWSRGYSCVSQFIVVSFHQKNPGFFNLLVRRYARSRVLLQPWLQSHLFRRLSPLRSSISLSIPIYLSGYQDMLYFLLRFSSSNLREVIYNAFFPFSAPDIVFSPEDEEFRPLLPPIDGEGEDESQARLMRSSLWNWNSKDPSMLFNLVHELRGLYVQYQRKRVGQVDDTRLKFEMSTIFSREEEEKDRSTEGVAGRGAGSTAGAGLAVGEATGSTAGAATGAATGVGLGLNIKMNKKQPKIERAPVSKRPVRAPVPKMHLYGYMPNIGVSVLRS